MDIEVISNSCFAIFNDNIEPCGFCFGIFKTNNLCTILYNSRDCELQLIYGNILEETDFHCFDKIKQSKVSILNIFDENQNDNLYIYPINLSLIKLDQSTWDHLLQLKKIKFGNEKFWNKLSSRYYYYDFMKKNHKCEYVYKMTCCDVGSKICVKCLQHFLKSKIYYRCENCNSILSFTTIYNEIL